MQFFDADQVHACCDYPKLVEALQRYHLEDTEVVDDLLLSQPADSGTETHFFVTVAGVPTSDAWEDGGTWTVEVEIDTDTFEEAVRHTHKANFHRYL